MNRSIPNPDAISYLQQTHIKKIHILKRGRKIEANHHHHRHHPSSSSRHRDSGYKLPVCSKRGIFPGACGKVAALLCSPLLPKIVKEVNTRGASSVHRIVSRASCVRPINLPGLFSSSLPCARVIALVLYVPCTRPWQRATNRRLTRLTSRITEPRKTTYRRLFSSRRRIPWTRKPILVNLRYLSGWWRPRVSMTPAVRGREILDIAERLGHLLSDEL